MLSWRNCFHGLNWGNLRWSSWLSLNSPSSEYQQRITKQAGFYRVRRAGRNDTTVGAGELPLSVASPGE